MSTQKPREIAVRILQQRLQESRFVEDLLDQEFRRSSLSPLDRGLCQELVYGVVRWQATLNFLIDQKTKLDARKNRVRILLQTGLYQLFWLTRIPEHAAVHETVELAKTMGLNGQSGLINAVLRGFVRERNDVLQRLEGMKTSAPSLGYSHPDWLYQKWRAAWPEKEVQALLAWNNSPPPTFVRRNSLKASVEVLEKQWDEEGVKFFKKEFEWTGKDLVYELLSHPPLTSMASFQAGYFYVQDPSTLLAVEMLQPQPGEVLLDLCAAPGGKVTFIADKIQDQGKILAMDTDPKRLELLKENFQRLGITSITPSLQRNIEETNPKHFDRILLDAPCSNTGVMRRRVDLRWRINPDEINRLVTTQVGLLNQAANQLKVGGVLVYSTCSMEPEENQGVIEKFLGSHPNFELDVARQLVPFRDRVDGAYVARLLKK